jgi:hypothetical protein
MEAFLTERAFEFEAGTGHFSSVLTNGGSGGERRRTEITLRRKTNATRKLEKFKLGCD